MSQLAIATPAQQPQTFQGRRIISTFWQGRKVQLVEGLLAYRRKEPQVVERARAEKALMTTVSVSPKLDRLGIGVLAISRSVSEEQAASAVVSLGTDISWVEPVMIDRGVLTPNDAYFPQQWALGEIRAERAWDQTTGSDNVILGVLDTGIPTEGGSLSHPDLSDSTRFMLGPDLVNNDRDPGDDHGHGTHVTGIAAAIANNNRGIAGLCWHCTVLAIKVFDSQMTGSSETFKDGVLEAVRIAGERNVPLVINYSGGGEDNNVKRTAVEYARDAKALLVAAVGNNYHGPILYPAAYSDKFPNVIAVGAVDKQRVRADFSSRGPQISVVAPGVDILSTMPNYYVTANAQGLQSKYALMSGTSMAAPLVSALAALIWSKWPQLSAEEVRQRIIDTAHPINGPREDYGAGIIDAEKALS